MLALFLTGNFSYKSRADFTFLWGLSLSHPVLDSLSLSLSFLSEEFLLHIPCWNYFFYRGVSLTHPILPLFFFGEFLLHIPCWLLFIVVVVVVIWGVSLTHPVLASFLSQMFLLHITCWLLF